MNITRRVYNIERVEKVVYTFSVEADSKADALRQIENCEVESDGMYGMSEQKAKVASITEYTACPNKGRAWSEIPLSEVTFDDDGNPRRNDKHFNWHYNGKCEGEKESTDDFCYKCRSAMRDGLRFTTSLENAWLNNRYTEGLKED